jgi:hypothetical protein
MILNEYQTMPSLTRALLLAVEAATDDMKTKLATRNSKLVNPLMIYDLLLLVPLKQKSLQVKKNKSIQMVMVYNESSIIEAIVLA